MEFRVAVANDYAETGSSIETAATFGCSASWVRRLAQRERETGSLAPKDPVRPDNGKLDDADLARLAALVASRPDMTLAELAAELGDKVSPTTVWRATNALKLTLKKKRRTRPSRAARTSRPHGPGGSPGSPPSASGT